MDNEYIIGSDVKLADMLKEADVTQLLRIAARAGASYGAVEDADGEILCHFGNSHEGDIFNLKKPFYLEGEIAGYVVIKGDASNGPLLQVISEAAYDALNMVLKSNLKSLLATETHRTVVNRSYEELLQTCNRLKESESRYRDLAESLEKQVNQRNEELKQAHAKLLHQEKIVSVGQLAAGIAHEINNPLGYILSNINTLKQYAAKMKEMLAFLRDTISKAEVTDEDRAAVNQKWLKYKLDHVLSDVEDLIRESIGGAERVKKIVSDLKGFSHIDEAREVDADLNAEIDRTLNVLTHEIPGDAGVIRDYRPLPPFTCDPADICQAFFNIILNSLQTGKEGVTLTIETRCIDDRIVIRFSDNGPGIPEEIKNRIFDPFFTTKEIGKGTGMGLNVTYEIVTSYGGSVDVESSAGEGATFIITLPVNTKQKPQIKKEE